MKRISMLFLLMALCVLSLDLAFPKFAQAGYLDPGSGSILVQGILAVFAFFGRIFDKIKKLFGIKTDTAD